MKGRCHFERKNKLCR